jgi:hypothetical protein
MRRRIRREIGWLILALVTIGGSSVFLYASQEVTRQKRASFERRIESRVAEFDAKGRPFVRVVLDLAYKYQLPLAGR